MRNYIIFGVALVIIYIILIKSDLFNFPDFGNELFNVKKIFNNKKKSKKRSNSSTSSYDTSSSSSSDVTKDNSDSEISFDDSTEDIKTKHKKNFFKNIKTLASKRNENKSDILKLQKIAKNINNKSNIINNNAENNINQIEMSSEDLTDTISGIINNELRKI